MTEKALEATEAVGLGVGSGSIAEQPIGDSSEKNGVLVEQNTRTVSPINDKRRHPDPNLSASVATMSFAGFTMSQVCNALRLSESTVRQYYDFEFKNGQTNLVSEIAGSLAQRALSGSDTAAIFLLKTRGNGKFSERNALELTGKDGGPIEIEHRAAILSGLAGALEQGITIDHEPDDEKKGGD